MSQPVDDGAAGEIQRKAQAERQSFLDITGRSLAGRWRKKIEPPQFVIGTEVAPVRAGGPSFPAATHGRLRIRSGSEPLGTKTQGSVQAVAQAVHWQRHC